MYVVIFGINTARDIYNNFKISPVVFMPNITTNKFWQILLLPTQTLRIMIEFPLRCPFAFFDSCYLLNTKITPLLLLRWFFSIYLFPYLLYYYVFLIFFFNFQFSTNSSICFRTFFGVTLTRQKKLQNKWYEGRCSA